MSIEQWKEKNPKRILTYEERVELLKKKEKAIAEATGQKFISPGVYASDRGPSDEYMDSQSIPRDIIW